MATRERSSEERLIKAMAHPLRFQLLIKLNERVASPVQLAKELGEPIGTVSYHVRILDELDAVELVDTRQVRGAIEHFYRATERPYFDDEHWAKLPVSVRRQFQDETLQGVWDHLVEATATGGLDRPDTHISWTNLELDEQGFEEVRSLLEQTLERALEIHAEAAGRQVDSGGEDARKRTELVILHYDRPVPPGKK